MATHVKGRAPGRRVVLFMILAALVAGGPLPGVSAQEDLARAGADVYGRYCIGCHGEKGDGKGKASGLLVVKPRDFSTGVFEFKSTPPGSLPTDEDLMRTIMRGLPGNSMPGYALLPESERRAVIAYIKTFAERWKTETAPPPLPIPAVPADFGSPDSLQKGREAYRLNGCAICHGESGDGKGPAAAALRDARGNPDKPRNFVRGVYESGDLPNDLFRTLTTGIEGTPMPAFPQIPDGDRWNLIAYLLSLREDRP